VNLGDRVQLVHRVIATIFLPNPEAKPDINHKNGIKDDNRSENLEWVTNLENRKHAVTNRLHAHGEMIARVLSEKKIREIRILAAAGSSQCDIGRRMGVAQQTICKIVHRKMWAHVP